MLLGLTIGGDGPQPLLRRCSWRWPWPVTCWWRAGGDRPVLARAAAGSPCRRSCSRSGCRRCCDQLAVKGNLARSAESWHLHLFATPLVFGVGSTLVWKDNASHLAPGGRGAGGGAVRRLPAAAGSCAAAGGRGSGCCWCWLMVPVARAGADLAAGQSRFTTPATSSWPRSHSTCSRAPAWPVCQPMPGLIGLAGACRW